MAHNGVASFKSRDGDIRINRDSTTRGFLIAVVLEPLGHVYGMMTSKSELLVSSDETPWVINVLDLMVIADCLDSYGPWLPLYIERRTRTLELSKVRTVDELDLFMHFLSRGLYFEDDELHKEYDFIHFGTLTDPLDWHYFKREGVRRKSAPRPKPALTSEVLRFIDRLEESKLPGWLDCAIALLRLNEVARKNFLDQVSRVRKLMRKDGRAHDFSLHDEMGGAGGLTYVCTPTRRSSFKAYAERKRHQLRVDEWVLMCEEGLRRPELTEIVVDRRKSIWDRVV